MYYCLSAALVLWLAAVRSKLTHLFTCSLSCMGHMAVVKHMEWRLWSPWLIPCSTHITFIMCQCTISVQFLHVCLLLKTSIKSRKCQLLVKSYLNPIHKYHLIRVQVPFLLRFSKASSNRQTVGKQVVTFKKACILITVSDYLDWHQ